MKSLFAALWLALCLVPAAFAQGASAPPDRSTLISALRKEVQSAEFLDRVAQQMGAQPELQPLVRSHMDSIFRIDGLVERIVDELLANPQVVKSDANARQLGQHLVLSLFAKGLLRLDMEDHRAFTAYMSALLEAMPVQECGGMFRSAGAASGVEVRYWHVIDRTVLLRYFELQRRAVGAELLAFPPKKSLQREELDISRNHLAQTLLPNLASQPNGRQLIDALRDLRAAPAPEACQVGRIMMSTMTQLKGLGGELALRQFALSMQ